MKFPGRSLSRSSYPQLLTWTFSRHFTAFFLVEGRHEHALHAIQKPLFIVSGKQSPGVGETWQSNREQAWISHRHLPSSISHADNVCGNFRISLNGTTFSDCGTCGDGRRLGNWQKKLTEFTDCFTWTP